MNVRRNLLLAVSVASVAATPAVAQDLAQTLAQGVAPAVRAVEKDRHTAASIPDFSGTWAHPYNPGLELPVSGPAPSAAYQRVDD